MTSLKDYFLSFPMLLCCRCNSSQSTPVASLYRRTCASAGSTAQEYSRGLSFQGSGLGWSQVITRNWQTSETLAGYSGRHISQAANGAWNRLGKMFSFGINHFIGILSYMLKMRKWVTIALKYSVYCNDRSRPELLSESRNKDPLCPSKDYRSHLEISGTSDSTKEW